MSKKSIRSFAEMRSLLKKTETEAEAKAVLKGQSGPGKAPILPIAPAAPVKRRFVSAADEFIEKALAIPLEHLVLDQLHDARDTIREAMECVNRSLVSIKRQLDSTVDNVDESWRGRATIALRYKTIEGQELSKRIARLDDMILRAKPALKLVSPQPAPTPSPAAVKPPALTPPPVAMKPSAPAAAYEIRTGTPLPPSKQQLNDEWRKYPFDKLEINQSFRFGTEKADHIRRMIAAAGRSLDRHFSYRTEPDGVVAVWRVAVPMRPPKKKR